MFTLCILLHASSDYSANFYGAHVTPLQCEYLGVLVTPLHHYTITPLECGSYVLSSCRQLRLCERAIEEKVFFTLFSFFN